MGDIHAPINIIGLSSLVNKQHVDTKLDLEKIEKNMIGSLGIKALPETDPTAEFRRTMRELSRDTGVSLVQEEAPEESFPVEELPEDLEPVFPSPPEPEEPEGFSPSSYYPQTSEPESLDYFPQSYPSQNYAPQNYTPQSYISQSYTPQSYPPQNYPPQPSAPPRGYQGAWNPPTGFGTPSSSHLDDVMRSYSGSSSDLNLEREREEDMKSVLLEDIDQLLEELRLEEIDVSRVPKVDQDSPIRLVQKVHRTLRVKYDRKRYSTFGTELFLAGAQGLGYAFNGKRKFGPFRPNLSGWHNTVRPKLRKMRYETASLTSEIMEKFNIGPLTRIALELVPSAFLYSHMNQTQENRYTPDQMSEAFDDLRQFN